MSYSDVLWRVSRSADLVPFVGGAVVRRRVAGKRAAHEAKRSGADAC